MATRALLESILQAPFFRAAAVAITICLLRLLYRRRKRISISYIPGPEKSDPIFGNLTDIYFKEAGEPTSNGKRSTARYSKFMVSLEYVAFNCGRW
jgi:hypothetical protein